MSRLREWCEVKGASKKNRKIDAQGRLRPSIERERGLFPATNGPSQATKTSREPNRGVGAASCRDAGRVLRSAKHGRGNVYIGQGKCRLDRYSMGMFFVAFLK